MGYLSELYASADWAFVGGGFGQGVHSTIEPAIHSIPILIGPKNAERFAEIKQLAATGQLTVVRNSEEVREWISKWVRAGTAERIAEMSVSWRSDLSRRLGASKRVLERIGELARLGATIGPC
jgi:3-deoxy-D-manno-octulosonic-acid transferase